MAGTKKAAGIPPADPFQNILWGTLALCNEEAADVRAALRSAVRAVVPGRQQRTNLAPLLHDAEAAFIRTVRRRAKARGLVVS